MRYRSYSCRSYPYQGLLSKIEKIAEYVFQKEIKSDEKCEILRDSQKVAHMFHISKWTLQRYRDNGLKYYTLLHKTYYKEKNLHEFIRRYFYDEENNGKKGHKRSITRS